MAYNVSKLFYNSKCVWLDSSNGVVLKRVFCIGNGESRKGFDLSKLRQFGNIYGCNALYRDFTPDVLTAVDNGIMHEIYQSGYCDKNETWLRNWSRVPATMYHMLVYGNMKNEDKDLIDKY